MRQPGQQVCDGWIGAGAMALLCALTLWAAGLLVDLTPAHAAPGPIWVVDRDGGKSDRGALFRVGPLTGKRKLVSDFGASAQGPLGSDPLAVAAETSGAILIVDRDGGTSGLGALFRVNPATGQRTLVSDFGASGQGLVGSAPAGVAVEATGHILVVDPYTFPFEVGRLFQVDPVTGQRALLSDFGDSAKGPLGEDPWAVAVEASGGILVVDFAAGTDFRGALFRVNATTGARALLSDFGDSAKGPLGIGPAAVGLEASGAILVVDYQAGTSGRGALFRVDPTSGQRTLLSDFGTSVQGPLGIDPFGVAVGAPVNLAPEANAGPDQTVNEGALVTLDGSRSLDPNDDALTYYWFQVAGPTVSLSDATVAQPTFVAPAVAIGGATLSFFLAVTDPDGLNSTDEVDITVTNVNNVPVADAGPNQTVAEGVQVTLDGSASFDLDGESLTYTWVQTAGTGVVLSGADTANPTFTAPLVGATGETLTFELTVSDGIDSASDTVDVLVENVNHPPTADAGTDQTVDEGSLVTLNGANSSDPDGDELTYSWTRLSGPAVVLSDSTSATPTFTAPAVGPGGETLVFELTVDDALEGSASDTVTITVLNVNDPPQCNLAQANPANLWPPNHKLIGASIVGVSDPNNDQVTISVTGVAQDEPTNGLGDGDTPTDAVINPDGSVLLRAERSGTGNGRVYHVFFTAVDGSGGECAGEVVVCVPHSARRACIDGGALYDSTQP